MNGNKIDAGVISTDNKLIRATAFLFLFFLPIVLWVSYICLLVFIVCFIWRHKFENIKLNYYFYILLGAIILSIIFSSYKLAGINALLLFLLCFISYLIFANIKIPEKDILNAMIFSGLVIVLFGIFQYFTRFHFKFDERVLGVRINIDLVPVSSTLGNDSRFAKYSLLILPFAVAHSFYEKSFKKKLFSLIFIILALFSFWAARSLGAILVVFGASFLLLWEKDKRIGIGVLLIVLIFGALTYKKLLLFCSIRERAYTYVHIIPPMIKTHPILGYGFGAYRKASPEFDKLNKGLQLHPHNVYAQFLCETGIVGLSAFLLFLWAFLSPTLKYCQEKAYRVSPIVIGGLAAVLLLLIFGLLDRILENYIFEMQVELFFFSIIGMVAGLVHRYKKAAE